MNTNVLIVVLAALVALAVVLLALLVGQRRRSAELQERFGPEYQRAVDEHGNKQRAEEELAAREKRVRALDIHPLTPEQRDRFQEEWRSVQAEFVDAPDKAVSDADHLVQEVMAARGYPVGDFEERAALVSVEHANVVTHYRAGHDIALRNQRGKATTEDLRQATVQYRALFQDLLETEEPDETPEEKIMETA